MLKLFRKKNDETTINHNANFRILIINLGSFQDVLSVTPLITLLYRNVSTSISLVIDSESLPAIKNNQHLKAVIGLKNGLYERIKFLVSLKKQNFDVIIDTNETYNTDFAPIIVSLQSAKFKIGFYGIYDKLLTHRISRPPINQTHMIDRYLKLIEPFNLEYSKSNVDISYKTSDSIKTEIEEYNIKHDLIFRFKVLINISNEKNIGIWNVDNYRRLIRYFKNYNLHLIIGSSTADYEIAEKIADGKLTIVYHDEFDRYAELIKQCNFVFSPDSFTIQLAGAYHVPTFCLFVQHNTTEMINVPYNSDFDFALTNKESLQQISYGKVLNSFIPFFDYTYDKFQNK